MNETQLRQLVAIEAAKLMYEGTETEYFTAKRKVAQRYRINPRGNPKHLPSNREIRAEILRLAEFYEGDQRLVRLTDMRATALEVLRILSRFRPKLIGSVCTGHIRSGSDIDVHVFSDSISAVTLTLDDWQLGYDVERKRVVKHGVARAFTHVHVGYGGHQVEITVYAAKQSSYPFKSSITGDVMEHMTLTELEVLVAREQRASAASKGVPQRESLRLLLAPLAAVQGGRHHPEGDQLFHSLQVFELARSAFPDDVEFAQAALLHDVGKAIDPGDHAYAGAEAISTLVSERVVWLVAHHMDALALMQGELGRRRTRRLREDPRFDDLMALRAFDTAGRSPSATVPDLSEALDVVSAHPDELSGALPGLTRGNTVYPSLSRRLNREL